MIGQVLGHYRILDKIGSGGMGEVYRARDERLKRNVAIKILSSQWSVGTEMKHLLLREAQSASSLNDPHICTIYEVGEVEGRDFIVMELVEGHPLHTLIPAGGYRLVSFSAMEHRSQLRLGMRTITHSFIGISSLQISSSLLQVK